MPTKRVVIGLLGTMLDSGRGPDRWERWRPTVSLCQHEDLLVDRLELLYPRMGTNLSEQVAEDIAQISPDTEVRTHLVDPTTRGTSRRSTPPCTTSPRRTRSIRRRGIPRPHHHRHARRPDLSVPAHRGAPLPGQADPVAPKQDQRSDGRVPDHRPRPVALRPHRRPLPPRVTDKHRRFQIRHRHPQRGVQPADRQNRAGRRRLRRRRSC